MTATNIVKLSCSAINSGMAVNMNVQEITIAGKNYVKEDERPGRFTSSDAVGTIDFVGWANPKISIKGVFNVNSTSSDTITWTMLKQFAKTTTSTYIYDDVYYPTGSLVQIGEFKSSRNSRDSTTTPGTTQGNIVSYDLTLIEHI